MRKEEPILSRFAVQQEYMHQSAAWQVLRFGEEKSELVWRELILKQVTLMMLVGVNGRLKQRGYWPLLMHLILLLSQSQAPYIHLGAVVGPTERSHYLRQPGKNV